MFKIVKEVMSCDVSPVAMFSCWFNHDWRWNATYILLVLLQSAIVAKQDLSLGEYKVDRNRRKAAPPTVVKKGLFKKSIL